MVRAHAALMLALAMALSGCRQVPDSGPPPGLSAPNGRAHPRPRTNFAWSRHPTLQQAAGRGLAGEVNGRAFPVQTVVMQPGPHGWDVQLADKPLLAPTEPLQDCQWVTLELGDVPVVGQPITKPFGSSGAALRVIDPLEPVNTVSWAPANAWVLQVDELRMTTYDSHGRPAQVVGRASGSLTFCAEGTPHHRSSWLAGSFKDAVVRYLGPPR